VKKNIHELLKICNENSGKILRSKEILKLFGYSTNTNVNETTAGYFLTMAGNSPGSGTPQMWKIGSWVIVTRDELNSLVNPKDIWEGRWTTIKYNQYLFPRDRIPWWRLKEYGGKL